MEVIKNEFNGHASLAPKWHINYISVQVGTNGPVAAQQRKRRPGV